VRAFICYLSKREIGREKGRNTERGNMRKGETELQRNKETEKQ
jgi:hypothetical protein